MRAIALVWLGLAACSSANQPPRSTSEPAASSPGSPGSPGSPAPSVAAAAPASGAPAAAPLSPRVGDACKPDRANPQSSCGSGQLCMPSPGGYCTAPCGATGAACPAGSACIPSVRGGELCARPCASDGECRTADGYVCDPGRKVCSLPFQPTPVLTSCPAPAPPDARGFAAPIALSTSASPGVYQFEPSGAVAPGGDLVVIYTSGGRFFGPSFLGIARVPRDGAPVIDQPLPTTKRSHFDPWAAATRDGAVHAVWLGHDGGGVDLNAEIGYARSRDGGATWTAPIAVHAPADCPPDTPFCLDKPMIAAGPLPGKPAQDAVRVFYSARTAGGVRMRSSLDGGQTWDAPVSAAEGAYGDVAIDGAGRIHLALSYADPSGPGAWGSPDNSVVYVASRDGKTFASPITVSAPGELTPFYFVNPSIEVDDRRGWIYVAYVAGTPDGRWDIRLAATRDAGKTWRRTKVNDDATCANHMVPNLALDPKDGTLHVTFFENRGGAGHVAYTTCKPGGASCAPATRISPDLAAYELVRHSSKWLGEYELLLVDPRRRMLHAAWTHTVQEGEHAIGRLRYTARKLAP